MKHDYATTLFDRLKKNGRTADGSPSFLSDWDVVRFIGSGCIGSVYEITKIGSALGEQHSALKVIELTQGAKHDENILIKHKDEIAALSVIRHLPNAVHIEDFSGLILNESGYTLRYLVIRMELLHPLPKDGMPDDEVIKMALDISDALAYCHSLSPRILHRDIKPSNILVSDNGTYKLSDFSQAAITFDTTVDDYCGTPLYMSPEVANFIPYDERCDLYSLGITMYSLLNGGKIPFLDDSEPVLDPDDHQAEGAAIRKRFNRRRVPRIKGVSPKLMRIVRKLCMNDPDKRFQTAQQLGDKLRELHIKKQRRAKK